MGVGSQRQTLPKKREIDRPSVGRFVQLRKLAQEEEKPWFDGFKTALD